MLIDPASQHSVAIYASRAAVVMTNLEKYFDIEKELNSFKLPTVSDFATRAIHVAQEPEQWPSRAVVPPIHLSSMYKTEDQENWKYLYLRVGSPSRDCLEKCFANLNNGKHAIMFSTGQGATSTLMLSLGAGSHIVYAKQIYGASYTLFEKVGKELEIDSSYVDFTDIRAITSAIRPNTKLIFFESPSNPLLLCYDIKAIADAVHAINKDILVAVDNTFLTPYFQQPLDLGADVVMYSCSKYINGHSDVVMGSLVVNDTELHDRLRQLQIRVGNVPSPFDCYLVQRGLKTLPIRMQQFFRNGLIVAKFLEDHPAVEKVFHPALKSHPQHEIAIKQASGHSGIFAFWLKNADVERSKDMQKKFKLITTAGSLGGCESLSASPYILMANSQPTDMKDGTGITGNLIRFATGLEDPRDIIADLDQALNTLL